MVQGAIHGWHLLNVTRQLLSSLNQLLVCRHRATRQQQQQQHQGTLSAGTPLRSKPPPSASQFRLTGVASHTHLPTPGTTAANAATSTIKHPHRVGSCPQHKKNCHPGMPSCPGCVSLACCPHAFTPCVNTQPGSATRTHTCPQHTHTTSQCLCKAESP